MVCRITVAYLSLHCHSLNALPAAQSPGFVMVQLYGLDTEWSVPAPAIGISESPRQCLHRVDSVLWDHTTVSCDVTAPVVESGMYLVGPCTLGCKKLVWSVHQDPSAFGERPHRVLAFVTGSSASIVRDS